MSLGTQPRMGGFLGDGVLGPLGFACWKPETLKNAKETLALEASDSPTASPEEIPEKSDLAERCRTPNASPEKTQPRAIQRRGVCSWGTLPRSVVLTLSLGLNIWA